MVNRPELPSYFDPQEREKRKEAEAWQEIWPLISPQDRKDVIKMVRARAFLDRSSPDILEKNIQEMERATFSFPIQCARMLVAVSREIPALQDFFAKQKEYFDELKARQIDRKAWSTVQDRLVSHKNTVKDLIKKLAQTFSFSLDQTENNMLRDYVTSGILNGKFDFEPDDIRHKKCIPAINAFLVALGEQLPGKREIKKDDGGIKSVSVRPSGTASADLEKKYRERHSRHDPYTFGKFKDNDDEFED